MTTTSSSACRGLCATLASLLLATVTVVAAGSPPSDRFADPPADARILKIIHGWPDRQEAQDALIAKLQGQGFGGVVCNDSFDHYLEGEPQWQAFIRAVHAARKAGLAMWLYDERGYPSGNAGGLVLRDHPEWEAHGLLIANKEVDAGPIELATPPGRLFFAAAFPVRNGRLELRGKVDLSREIRDDQLRWLAPAGRWQVMAVTESRLYEGTHAEGNLWQKLPYLNLLMPEPTARFIQLTHERYAERLGPNLGEYFEASFTDEPSLMSCFLKPMPYRPLPWAPNLPVEFKKRRGYALDAGVVPALIADAGPTGQKHRYDFWLTVGELVSENYFGQIQTAGRAHHLPSGGHLLMEENIVAHVPLYGDFFRCARRLDAPGIDCLTSLPPEVPWYIARLLASAAEVEGRRLVMCETSDHSQVWRPAGDTRPRRVVTETEIRGTCNRLIVSGVNCITSYYSFTDLTDDQLRRLNEWVGRCCARLRGGHQVADIALLYPVESVWTKFTPARLWANEAPAALRIESTYRAAMESLFAAQREFTVVDSRTLAEAPVDQGALVHGSLRWRVVVLPGVDTLPLRAWANLARFVRRGGVVIALGARPANSEAEFPSRPVQRLAAEIFGSPQAEPRTVSNATGGAGVFLPHGAEGLLPLVLDGALEPDVKVAVSDSPLRTTHRRIAGKEVYFLVNDSPHSWAGDVSLSSTGNGELLDPATGRITPSSDAGSLSLSLEPYSAVLAQFDRPRLPQRRAVPTGSLPGLSLRAVPPVEPTTPGGEFVRASLNSDPAHLSEAGRLWQVTGAITKSQVDTFLFVQFHYAQGLEFADAQCLVLDTWVPDGQSAPGELLVILAEEGGEDFIATTGRSLAVPGHERSFVPLRQFQRAGWSKGGDGVLEPERVRDIRVGWGGYLGTAGEVVRFQLALPQLGSVRH